MAETPPGRNRWRWFKREAIDLGDVAVQIFAVVIGILLALFINDWVTQRQQQANVDDAMRAIRAELSSNRTALRTHAEHLFAMAARMRAAPENQHQSPRPCYKWDDWRGIGGLNLVDAAYQTAIATQALANMPFKQAQLVAQIYGWQHYLQQGADLNARLFFGPPQKLSFCTGIIGEIARGDLQVDGIYAGLIGPDTAPPPMPPPASTPSSRQAMPPPGASR